MTTIPSPVQSPVGSSNSDDCQRIHITPTKTPVYRVDQGSKKKNKERYIHKRDSIERRMKPGKPGTPRYQRYINLRFLTELQCRLSDDEGSTEEETEESILQNDFIEQEESFFAELFDPTNPKAMTLWEPFISIDVDDHDVYWQELCGSVPESSPLSCMPKQHGLPQRYWEPLQRCVKNASYYMLLCSLESHVVHYLDFLVDGMTQHRQVEGDNWASLLDQCRFTEPGQNHLGASVARDKGKYPHLNFSLPDSYQRLLCHAVCAYYMLHSESDNAADGRRITTVRLRQTPKSVAGTTWVPTYPSRLLVHHVKEQ